MVIGVVIGSWETRFNAVAVRFRGEMGGTKTVELANILATQGQEGEAEGGPIESSRWTSRAHWLNVGLPLFRDRTLGVSIFTHQDFKRWKQQNRNKLQVDVVMLIDFSSVSPYHKMF